MPDREKLIELLDNFCVCDDWYSNGEIADHLIANGVTVRERGRWEGTCCTLCGGSYMDYADADSYPAIGEPKPDFCPNCGADMRGEEDG